MKVIKINSSFIRPHTIKSFSVYAEIDLNLDKQIKELQGFKK